MDIRIQYTAIDGAKKGGIFKTLDGAKKFAWRWVGMYPDRGQGYAISADGIGKITFSGVSVEDLFPGEGGISTQEKFDYSYESELGQYDLQEQYDAQERMAAQDRW
jgi:hypothetical protein